MSVKRKFFWTIPIVYSGQDFDEIQVRAAQITEDNRKAGRPAPLYGYSEEAFEQAQKERNDCARHRVY